MVTISDTCWPNDTKRKTWFITCGFLCCGASNERGMRDCSNLLEIFSSEDIVRHFLSRSTESCHINKLQQLSSSATGLQVVSKQHNKSDHNWLIIFIRSSLLDANRYLPRGGSSGDRWHLRLLTSEDVGEVRGIPSEGAGSTDFIFYSPIYNLPYLNWWHHLTTG